MTTRALKFKRLLRLREPLIVAPKVLSFKKQKWDFVRSKLLKRKEKAWDQNLMLKQRRGFFFNKFYLFNLVEKQKINSVYGNLKLKFWKKLLSFFKNYSRFSTAPFDYIIKAEQRLDTVLIRCKFGKSFRQSRSLINSGKIFVNGFVVKSSSYIVTAGDCIRTLVHPCVSFVESSEYFPSASFCEIDYRRGAIYIFKHRSVQDTRSTFPVKFDQNKLSNYLRIS